MDQIVSHIRPDTAPRLRLQLRGPLRVFAPDGAEITPRGAKNCALLAVLALSPDLRRPRRWIEQMLWRLTGEDQARASLRQALTTLRRELGPLADCLGSDRREVWLDPDQVEIDSEGEEELLQSMEIRDPHFAEWLAAERKAATGAGRSEGLSAAVDGVVLRYLDRSPLPPEMAMLRDRIVTSLGKSIQERMRSWMQSESWSEAGPEPDLEMDCNLALRDGAGVGFVKLIHKATGQILHSEVIRFDDPLAAVTDPKARPMRAAAAAEKSIARIAEVMGRDRPAVQASALAEEALEQMFTFRASGIRGARTRLDEAADMDKNGVFHAWRGLAGMFENIERLSANPLATLDEMQRDAAIALEMDPGNPLVNALTAVTHMVSTGDANTAEARVRQALSQNPDSAMAWLAQSVALGLAGRAEEAFQASAQARRLAAGSRYGHWWDMFHCISAITTNRLDAAREAGESAALRAPGFRAPYRHLLPLYAHQGDGRKARAMAAKLSNIEHDFSLQRLREDPDYPVRSLRNSRLIDFPLQVF